MIKPDFDVDAVANEIRRSDLVASAARELAELSGSSYEEALITIWAMESIPRRHRSVLLASFGCGTAKQPAGGVQ